MNSILTNDFLIAFELVSKEEKKSNSKISEIKEEITSMITYIKEKAKKLKRSKDETK